ncbi:hypothetical protein BGX30_004104 [Mortierella sp. GBA39]|nr:hypothetical protein BGX30_004104 [Mortierella sp. GBA39]
MNSQPTGNSHPTEDSHPTGNSGSISDTLKGYVNEAIEQAKVLGHKAQDQFSHVMGHHHEAATHSTQQKSDTAALGSVAGAEHQAQVNPQADAQTGMNNQDAFSDLNQFNTQATADNSANQARKAAANTAYKASQTTL